jgi:hypothetical protein
VIAACKSAAPNESISCSFVGVPEGEGDGVVDLAGDGVLLGDGVAEGDGDRAGDCAKACAAIKIEITIAEHQTNRNITLIVIR